MKKNLTRIFATASAVVAIVFVIVLLVAVFGGIKEADFDNSLVKGLFIALGIIYLLLTAVTLVLLFINDELVKELVLSSGKDGGTTITVADVKKKTKTTVALIEGVKCTKCVIVDNEYGVRLKITIKVKERDICDIENYVRACLEDAFDGAYNFRFHSIEIRVKKLESKYKVDAPAIMAREDARVAAEKEAAKKLEEAEQAASTDDGAENAASDASVDDAVSTEETTKTTEVAQEETEEEATEAQAEEENAESAPQESEEEVGEETDEE